MQKNTEESASDYQSFLELVTKWAALEEEMAKGLDRLVRKINMSTSIFAGLKQNLRERCDAGVGLAEWLRTKVVGKTKDRLRGAGKFEWSHLSSLLERSRQIDMERAAIERSIEGYEQDIRKETEKGLKLQAVFNPNAKFILFEVDAMHAKVETMNGHLVRLDSESAELRSSFVSGPIQDLRDYQTSCLAAIKDGLLESVAVCEEHLIWENGHLDDWKMALFNHDPEKMIESNLLSILCRIKDEDEEKDAIDNDILLSDAFFLSKADLDGRSDEKRRQSYFTIDDYISIVPRSRFASLDIVPDYDGCATWDADTVDDHVAPN